MNDPLCTYSCCSMKDPVYVADPAPLKPTLSASRPAAPYKPQGNISNFAHSGGKEVTPSSYSYGSPGSSIRDPLYNYTPGPVHYVDVKPDDPAPTPAKPKKKK